MDGVKAAGHLSQPDLMVSSFNSNRNPSVQTRVDGNPIYKGQPVSRSSPNVGPSAIYSRGDPSRYVSYPQHQQQQSSTMTPASAFRNAEERGAGPSRQRMSLLHPPPLPSQPEYMMSQAATNLTPRPDRLDRPSQPYGGDGMMKISMNESPPCKKLRLGDAKDLHQPLRIDTERARSGPAYNPQVEAISPTLPSETIRDESPLRSTKEELLQQIARVDREIAKTESQIAKLKKKRKELEEASTQPQRETEESNQGADLTIRTLPQRIYAENRKKAQEAHHMLEKLGPKVDLPLYNQPSDTSQYHENKLKYANFKPRLLEYFKTRRKEKERREEYLTTTYAKLSTEWAKRLEKLENNGKKRAKDAKNREVFEKMFQELRKQREDKERFSRVGSRIKSDADLEEIMDGLHEQELEDKKMRSYAVIPPILLDERSRKRKFINRNGLIEDPMQEYKDKQLLNLWTEQEKEIFKEKYLQHPKNFGIIKSYLERKSIADCVQYYYLSKKTQNYRQLLRKNRARTRSTRNQQQNANHAATGGNSQSASIVSGAIAVVKGESNGVTTRHQKEQKMDTQNSVTTGALASNSNTNYPSGEGGGVNAGNSAPNFTGATDSNAGNEDLQQHDQSDFAGQKKEGESISNRLPNELDTSDEENMDLSGDKGGPHNCVVCKTNLESFLQSRPLVPTQAMQYGLNEEDIQTGDRVCSSCRCKAVRRRYKPSHCPIPTCPARRARIKRLRPFPPKWAELPSEIRQAICDKYQIAPNVTKCCTACFNRISRRLSPNASLDTPDDPGSDTSRWTDEEVDIFKKSLLEVGTDWQKLSERVSSKSELQCRNFYFNFRKKHGLEGIVQEFKKSKGGDGPPTLTDEEESGSTTSSCDEGINPTQDQARPIHEKKDDYDSSATVSAEEGAMDVEKPHQNINDMKTLPNHPNESPLQLTIRGSGSSAQHPSHQQQHGHHPPSSHHLIPPPPPGPMHPNHQMINVSHSISGQGGGPGSHHTGMPRSSPQGLHHSSIHSTNAHLSQAQVLPSHGGPLASQSHSHLSSHHHFPGSAARYTSPDNNDTQEVKTVKDLMLVTIERQLRRNPVPNPNQHPGPSISPTITSILKSQDRSHIPPQHHSMNQSNHPPVSHSQQQQQQQQQQQSNPHPSMSHPSSTHFGHQPHPQIFYGKVDPRGGGPPHHMVSRESLPMIQVQHQQQRDECETLDLSMKKRPSSPPTPSQRPSSTGGPPPPAHQPLDYATNRQDVYYPKYSPVNRGGRPGQGIPQPPPQNAPKSKGVPGPPPLLTKTPALSPIKDGSITHGTPLHHSQVRLQQEVGFAQQQHGGRGSNLPGSYAQPMQGKYEGLLRPSKEGSITQGTPLDKRKEMSTYVMYDRAPAEYYKRMSPAAPYHYHGTSSPYYPGPGQRPPSSGPGQRSPPVPPSPGYPTDQHSTSRQIIMNDYFTSQQMQQPPAPHPHPSQSPQQNAMGGSRMDPNLKRQLGPGGAALYLLPQRHEVPYRQSPPPSQQQQQRQGVIHRANTHHQNHFKGGIVKVESTPSRIQHDAFTSLVDIAAAQPSLPVPKEEPRNRVGLPRVDMVREGLGKSIVEMERTRMNSHPHPSHQHQPQPQIYRSPGHPQQIQQQQQQQQQPPNQFPPEVHRMRREMEAGGVGGGQRMNRGEGREPDGTLTAASLIDAIITHQINQPSAHDRQSPSSRTGDRLFASLRSSHQPPGVHQRGDSGMNIPPHHHDQVSEEMKAHYEGKTVQGGTWGDHIDLIITKNYASGKGPPHGVQGGSGPVSQHQSQISMHHVSHPRGDRERGGEGGKEEDMGPYISWKLKKALQHSEKEAQLHHSPAPHPNHPDERHIIRVMQQEPSPHHHSPQHGPPPPQHHSQQPQHISRPPSKEQLNYPPRSEEQGENLAKVSTSTSASGEYYPKKSSSRDGREGISPLDYVKNRIMEVMRTENNGDKSTGEVENPSSSNEANSRESGEESSQKTPQSNSPNSSTKEPNTTSSESNSNPRADSGNQDFRKNEATAPKRDEPSKSPSQSNSDTQQGGENK